MEAGDAGEQAGDNVKQYPHKVGINNRSNFNQHKLAALLGGGSSTAATTEKKHFTDAIETSFDAAQDQKVIEKKGETWTNDTLYTIIRNPGTEDGKWLRKGIAPHGDPKTNKEEWELYNKENTGREEWAEKYYGAVQDVDIMVGDIVQLRDGMTVPVDMVLLTALPSSRNNEQSIIVDTQGFDQLCNPRFQKVTNEEGAPFTTADCAAKLEREAGEEDEDYAERCEPIEVENFKKLQGEVLCQEADGDCYTFEGTITVTDGLGDKGYTWTHAIDMRHEFLGRGCKIEDGCAWGLAVFVGAECKASKAAEEIRRKERILKNKQEQARRGRRSARPTGVVVKPTPTAPVVPLRDSGAVRQQEATARDKLDYAEAMTPHTKKQRKEDAKKQRHNLGVAFAVATVVLAIGVALAMYFAVKGATPPPPPPVSKPAFGTTSPWANGGQGTTYKGGLWGPASVVAKNNSAVLYFNAPAHSGGTTILDYTITAQPGGAVRVCYGPPYTFTGLTNDKSYTFTLVARNKMGVSDQSVASPTVVPHDVQRQAIKDLYDQTGGPKGIWRSKYSTSWGGYGADFCAYDGITCTNGKLTHIELIGDATGKLQGTLPGSIGNLADLTRINFYSNLLNGTIPESIGELVQLEDLQLWNNEFKGKVPDSLRKLQKLVRFGLENNQLTHISEQLDRQMRQSATLQDKQGNTHNNCRLGNNPWQCPIPDIAKHCNPPFYPMACTTPSKNTGKGDL